MVARRNELADALAARKGEREPIADAILEMFYCWSETRRMEADKLARTAAKYAEHVQDQPLWAVKKACGVVEREDRAWPPSPGELRAQVLKEVRLPIEEVCDLRKVLAAEVYTPTKRGEEAKQRIRHLADRFKHGACADQPFKAQDFKQHPDAEAERQLAEFDVRRGVGPVNHDKPLTVSSSLKDTLGKGRAA